MGSSDALGAQRRPVVSGGSGEIWGVGKKKILGAVLVLLFGFLVGYVVHGIGFMFQAVDSFKRSSESPVFTAFDERSGYGR